MGKFPLSPHRPPPSNINTNRQFSQKKKKHTHTHTQIVFLRIVLTSAFREIINNHIRKTFKTTFTGKKN